MSATTDPFKISGAIAKHLLCVNMLRFLLHISERISVLSIIEDKRFITYTWIINKKSNKEINKSNVYDMMVACVLYKLQEESKHLPPII